MNYDRTIATDLATELSKVKLLEFVAAYDDVDPARVDDWLAILNAASWVNPQFKRHPMAWADQLTPGERKLFISPVADENELTTREASDWTLKLAITHILSLLPWGTSTDLPEPDADQLEAEVALDEMLMTYMVSNLFPPELGDVMMVERGAIYDFEKAQDESIFHSTIVVTIRIEQ